VGVKKSMLLRPSCWVRSWSAQFLGLDGCFLWVYVVTFKGVIEGRRLSGIGFLTHL